ncbi:MAG: PAS domain S-box protein [Parcubacteria group bacterium]|nr:PAS domain S-box protein [Parcubacteria group bacterium]
MIFLTFWKRLKITAKFIIVTVLIIAAVTFVNVLFARFIIERAILESTKTETAALIQRMVGFHLLADDFLRGATPEAYKKFSDFSDAIRTPGIVRIKVWDKNARVLFSEDQSIIGKQFPDNAELLESFSGKVEAEIQTPQKAENISEEGYRQLIEIYVPVSFEGQSEPAGVVETYYSLDAVNALVAKLWWALFIASCLAALIFVFTFWKLFQRLIQEPLEKTRKFALEYMEDEGMGKTGVLLEIESHDEIGEVNRAINQMLSQLRSFHGELEKKVKERTADLSQKIKELRMTKRSLQTTKEDLQKFYEAVEGAAEHIIITDADGFILYANKAAETITGYSMKAMIGQRPSLWGGQMEKTFYEKMWKTIKIDKEVFHGEMHNKRKNGDLYTADLRISPILDNRGAVKFFVGIERDVTREREIDRLKNEFVSLASHQLQTPLTAIKWVVERLLKKEEHLSERGKEYLADISLSGQRLYAEEY